MKILINPEAWDNWKNTNVMNLCNRVGIATLFEAEGDYWDRLEPPVYDLFDL